MGFRACHARLATAALALLPSGLYAEQLDLGVRSEAYWTDNVFGLQEDAPGEKQDDASGRVSPWAEVSDQDGDLTGGLRYEPSYEYYLDQSELRGFDHDVRGRLEWRVTPATTLRVSDRFRRYHSISRFNEQAAPGEDIVAFGTRERLKDNGVNVSLDRSVGPRDLVTLSVFHNLTDFSGERPSQSGLGSAFSYKHQVSERTDLGSRLGWARQTFERSQGDDQSTDYFNLSGVFSHEFSRTFRMDLSAGPALIRSDSQEVGLVDVDLDAPGTQVGVIRYPLRQEGGLYYFLDADTCPQDSLGNHVLGPECESLEPSITQGQFQTFSPFNRKLVSLVGSIPGVDETNITYFATLSLQKEWERWEGQLAYNRSFSNSTAVAAVSDIVYGTLRWKASQRWTAELGGSYERQQQASENVGLVTVVSNGPGPDPNPEPPQFGPPIAATTQALRAEEVDSDAGIDYYRFNLRLTYALTRRSSLYTDLIWQEQRETGDILLVGKTKRFSVAVGINYFFDPIRF